MFDMNYSVGEERNPPTGFLATLPSLLKLKTCSNVEANGFVLYDPKPQNKWGSILLPWSLSR